MDAPQVIKKRKPVHGYLLNLGALALPPSGLIDSVVTTACVSEPVRRMSLWLTTQDGHQLRYDAEMDESESSKAEIARLIRIADLNLQPKNAEDLIGRSYGLRFDAGCFCGFECPTPSASEVK
jgi:hypothetical protein